MVRILPPAQHAELSTPRVYCPLFVDVVRLSSPIAPSLSKNALAERVLRLPPCCLEFCAKPERGWTTRFSHSSASLHAVGLHPYQSPAAFSSALKSYTGVSKETVAECRCCAAVEPFRPTPVIPVIPLRLVSKVARTSRRLLPYLGPTCQIPPTRITAAAFSL